MNEIDLYRDERPEAAPYDPGTRAAARSRLASGRARRVRGPYVMVAAAGALALAAAFVVTRPAPVEQAGQSAQVGQAPQVRLMSASEVLDRAAGAVVEELDPRDDQYVVVKSQTMYGSYSMGEKEERWLYRTNRTIWLRAEQTGDDYGVLRMELLEPREFPGWPIPKQAYEGVGKPELIALANCDGGTVPEHLRSDYAAIKKLPVDAEGMRAHLYSAHEPNEKGVQADQSAFTRASDLLRETYVPAPQRKALYQALATIPGVSVAEGARDAAGREGIGVGLVTQAGTRDDLIFDRESFALLGERSEVVDAAVAGAPAGSLLASTAQLEVSVADEAPEVAGEPCRTKG